MGIILLVVAGLLVGGTWSMYQQGAGKPVIAVFAALALLATIGGFLWL